MKLLRLLAEALHPSGLPYKLNFITTKECHSRCVHCRIWEVIPKNELTLAEVRRFAHANSFLRWVNFTGGEPTDRPDFARLVMAFVDYCPDLAVVHFPTNGLNPYRIVAAAQDIAQLRIPKFTVTVSIDGPPRVHDLVRGVSGNFDSAIDTFKQLRELKGVNAYIGMTLFPNNHRLIYMTMSAIRQRVPKFSYQHFHVNLGHVSGMFYENTRIKRISSLDMIESLREYRQARGWRISPLDWIEDRFHKLAETYLSTGVSPIPCAALLASVMMDEHGEIYPCSIWGKKLGNVRDYGYRIEPILEASKAVREQVIKLDCPNCWTPCEAFQSMIAGNKEKK
jgi:MoaA/NifB/PqqE/SkfB family radical SAM enzyme